MTVTRLLVANRGEIAARIIRTARAMDIATVAVFSDPDADLPFVRDADEAVHLPGSTPGETYLRIDAILAAAKATGADAVHPGYGFLSENADFARACADAGLTFVGPSPDAIESMGSKTAAKELMAAAGVPVLPGAVFGGDADPTDEDMIAAAEQVGFPVLVKAAFGGGGRGMRIVTSAADVVAEVASARREAAAAFGNGTVFLERFVDAPRHIEVQIVGDTAGTVVHLFERECSIQRRYQKIIEEAPSPAVDEALRAQLCDAAVAAGKAIGYTGAGTVEFVLDSAGTFWFLEVNTRLQVEHPVTEAITGLDLVRIQLQIATGEPLPPEVLNARIRGHAIEARLYAEDVPAGYLPAAGRIDTFDIGPADGLRVDAGFASGTTVSTFYDSMLAKVIALGPTRDAARRTLAAALDRARVHGVVTNREYQKIIEEAPSPAVDEALRAQLCDAAVAAGKAIGYTGAGTVEFVLDSAGTFWFLEVNTRLQVEHPVTEAITGLDLVRIQLQIATGEPLPPEVLNARIRGHAIEARLYAEDVPAGYLPAAGRIDTFDIGPADGLRVDAGFASGTTVSTFYDSMLAKVIALGPTRDAARRTLAAALDRARVHGVVTNRELLVAVLREREFAAGDIDTGYLTRHPPEELLAGPDLIPVHALAAALAAQAGNRADAAVLGSLPSGWRNNPSGDQRTSWRIDERTVETAYRIGRSGLTATVDGTPLSGVRLWSATPSRVDLEIDGIRRQIDVTRFGPIAYIDSARGHTALIEQERFPDPTAATAAGSLLAPMPGTVIRVEVEVDDVVGVGARIITIEAMKMEHSITAPAGGRVVGLHVVAGDQVDSGMVLAVLAEVDDG